LLLGSLVGLSSACGRIGFERVDRLGADARPRDDSGQGLDGGASDGSSDAGSSVADGGNACQDTCICETGQSCFFECDSPCTVVCEDGSSCSVDCLQLGDECVLQCATTATCRMSCARVGFCMFGNMLGRNGMCMPDGTCG
jgi:hypothetical protein